MQNILSPISPTKHPWMVKLGSLGLASSGLTGICGTFATLIESSSNYNPFAALIVSFFLLAWSAVELVTAWGVWQLNEMSRKAFIAVVAINAFGFLCGLTDIAKESIWAAVLSAVFGLAVRGYFIYWFVDNHQYFRYSDEEE